MATTVTWPGSSSFFPGETPFGLYDSDTAFQADADNLAKWCAYRLGYPTVDIELTDIQFYACFEEATSEYSSQVNRCNIKDNLLSVQGVSTASNLTHRNVHSSGLSSMISLAKDYGSEAGSGGNVTWYTGSIQLSKSTQIYDLTDSSSVTFESGTPGTTSIELKRVFYQADPAINRYFDPYLAGMDAFGWQNYSTGVNYLMMPLYDDLLRIQEIEFNDTIRKSAYSFEISNNRLRLFPTAQTGSLYFQYIKIDDRQDQVIGTQHVTSDFSNINYQFMDYCAINSPGRQWIRKYTLALSKELLGEIRSKYGSIPSPGGEVTLDGDTLRSEAAVEKENLITTLRDDLEASSKRNLFERQKDISEFHQETLNRVPLPIYIG